MGSTSGSCTLQEQAVAGTSVLTLPVGSGTVVANNVNSAIVSGTAVASTSGTAIDFTGIPSWAKRITVMFNGVSTNGSSNILVRLGTSGGVAVSGYLGSGTYLSSGAATNIFTNGFGIRASEQAAAAQNGFGTIVNFSGNTWVYSGSVGRSDAAVTGVTAGSITLGETLDRIRITTVNGTDTFDAGSINILYE
jgi:hypothetical protein